MPLYDRQCGRCGQVWDVYRTFADCDRGEPCPTCGWPHSRRLLTKPTIHAGGDILGYYDMGVGRVIKDRADRKRLEKQGIMPLTKADTQAMLDNPNGRDRQADEASLRAGTEKIVRRVLRRQQEDRRITINTGS